MRIFLYLLVLVLSISCKNSSKLEQNYQCSTNKTYHLNKIYDFNNNFSIKAPINWKTNLYYDKNSSDVYLADTLKELTKSFIIGVSFFKGNLNLNKNYIAKSDSIASLKELKKIDSKQEKFLNKPTYWFIAKGTKNGFTYQQLNVTIKDRDKSFIIATVEIYGDKFVKDRICNSISILKSIQFLQ